MKCGFATILVLGLVVAVFTLSAAFYVKQKLTTTEKIITQPSPPPQSFPIDETTNWKTYTSKFGYQFNYPSDYQTQLLEGVFEASINYNEGPRTGGGPPNYGFNLTLSEPLENKESLTAQEYGENYQKKSSWNPKPKVEYVKISGIDAVLTETGDSPHTLFIPYKGKIYRLDASFSSGKNIDYPMIFEQILSTFKFLDQK